MSLWSYSVLALLSEGYPQFEGRLPTYYSPVCHFTHELPRFLVRLACIRHAASVRSEPGSNSSVKVLSTVQSTDFIKLSEAESFKEKTPQTIDSKSPLLGVTAIQFSKIKFTKNSRVRVLVKLAVHCQQLYWRSFSGSKKLKEPRPAETSKM